jgi:ribosome biogenesis GTPase
MTKPRLTDQQARRVAAQRTHSGIDPNDAGEAGVVIASYGKQVLVEHDDHQRTLCHLRAHLTPPVAGDRVIWTPSEETGVISALVERRNVLERPDIRGRLRPIAANIDLMLVVFAPEPAPQPHLLDRYLVAAAYIDVEPVLVLNKADLITDAALTDQLAVYAALGYRTLITDHNMPHAQDLIEVIGDDTLILVGQSGVGKSSLIQRLLPDVASRVGALSVVADKGRHTTTTTELFPLPRAGRLIDSPGVRDFGLSHLPIEAVERGFREFQPLLGHCRFRDCRHQSEPGCALLNAVSAGVISPQRFDSFLRIRDDLQSST